MAQVGTFKRAALLSTLVFAALASACAQAKIHGSLDPGLYCAPDMLSPAIFNPTTAEGAAAIGVASQPGDKLYEGNLDLGSGPVPRYRIRAVIVRSPDGTDVLYVDANQNAHLDQDERIPFRPLPDTDENKGEKDVAEFNAVLPNDPMSPFPMEVRLITDPERTVAKPSQLPLLYTKIAFVQGYVRVAHRKVHVRFQYNFTTRSVDIDHGREWLDLNGDGKFDIKPGSPEFLRANGSAPVFRIGHRMLQLVSVNLAYGTFVLRSIAASGDTRLPSASHSSVVEH
jgi:hypothetical protein